MTKILQMQSSLHKDNTHIAGLYEMMERGNTQEITKALHAACIRWQQLLMLSHS